MHNHRVLRILGIITVIITGLISLIASDNTGTITPPPELGLRIVTVSDSTPEPGDSVTITWDYENPDLLEMQGVRIVSLLLNGNIATLQQGCLPNYEPNQACMSQNQRAVQIDFRSPITVIVDSIDTDNRVTSKAVKLRIPGMSFRLTQLAPTNPGYPRFTGDITDNIEFDKAFGIYARVNQSSEENGVIDHLANISIPGFNQTDTFFGFSYGADESTRFNFRNGTSFPLLNINFINTLAPGQQIWQSPYADGVIYAGMLGISGDAEAVRTNSGEDAIVHSLSADAVIEPFFVQIDIRSTDQEQTTLFISDLHAGNSTQGLVLSSFLGDFDPGVELGNLGDHGIEITASSNNTPDILLSNGVISRATVGFPVLRTNTGEQLLLVRAGISATWNNIPLFPDDDLSALFLRQFPSQLQ